MQTTSQAATAEYYLESQQSYRSNTLYYTTGEEPDGVWWNPNALFSEFELIDGEQINNTAFGNLYNGMSPDGGDKLTRNAGSKDRSSGIDLTFSADKSVSTLWAIADPALREAIEKCHNDAARHALNSIYKEMVSYTRRGQKGAIEVVKADILGAMFQHGSSRENDPQLHTHCMIFNVAKTVDDGKWRALHQAPFYRWTKASGAVYRHALAWKLQQDLGIRMERYGQDDQFVRIVGMPEDLMKFWSKRTAQIVAAAKERGIVLGQDAQRDAGIKIATRASKETDSDPNLRSARFLKEAERFIDREQVIENVLGSFKELDAANLQDVVKVCNELPKQLTVHEAVFRLTDLIEQIAKNTAGDVQPEAIQTLVSRVIGLDEVVMMDQTEPTPEASAKMAHTTFYSTMTEITEEHEIAEYGQELLSRTGYAIDKETIDAMIDKVDCERDFNLAKEQREAIHHLAGVDGGVTILEGPAGAGKTSVLRPVTDLYKAKGYNVIAAATAWRVANDLGNGCKINRYSVAAMLQKTGTGKMVLDDKTVVLIDEAGQLSVRQMHRLLRLSDETGAKIVFVGDLKQQQAIEAGPGLRLLKEEAVRLRGKDAGSAVLTSMRRQKLDIEDLLVITKGMSPESARLQESFMSAEERREVLKERDRLPPQAGWMNEASRNFKDQKAIEGIKAYAERGRFKMCAGVDDTYNTLVEDWHTYRQANPGHSTIVMARTNLQVNELSLRLRERHLSDEDRQQSVSISTSKGLSGKRDVQTLEVARGDILKIGTTVWEKRLFNGTLITVTDIKTAYGAAEDGTDRHHIRAIDNNGREIAFFSDEIKDYYGNVRLDYGYAMTISMAQGAEAHAAFGLMDDRSARESAYVVVTRHQESLHMYADRTLIAGTIVDRRPEDEWNKPVTDEDCHQYLGLMLSREGDKVAAFDYASDGQAEELIERVTKQRDEQKVQNLTEMLRGMGGISVDHDQSSDTGNQASRQAQSDDSDAAASGILTRLMRRNSVFTLRQLRGVVHGEGYRKDEMDAVVRGVLRDKRVMPLYGVDSDQLNPSFTTTSVYAEERKLVETARSLSGQTTDLSLGRIKSSLARSVKNHDLDQEQTELVKQFTCGDRLTVGRTGDGSHRHGVLSAASEVIARSGGRIIGLSSMPNGLQEFDGITSSRMTVTRFLSNLTTEKYFLRAHTTVMVSDAAALDRKSTYTLLKAAEQAGFNVILTDDDRSIAGMGEGATFSHLLEQFEPSKSRSKALPLPGHTPAKDHALLDMASSLDWRGVFETLEQDGRVVQYEDKEDAIAVIAKAWVSNDQNSPSLKQAVVGGTNAEVAALNAAIQHERVKIGGLEAGHTLNVVKPVWTETESKGLEAVYHADTLTLYKGDDIRFLRSERQYGIESGAVGRVVDVNSKKLIVEIDGQQIKLDPHKSNAFELGYASTLSRSKNHQSEHVHVLHSKMWDSRAAYSSLTLHTVNSTLYCDKDPRMADLAEQVAKRSNDTFTQNFVDRQTALSASNESDVVSLQQSWSLLSKEERVSITERDRQQFDEITAQIRVNESPVGAWVRAQKLTNMPFTNIANSVRNAMAGMKHADEAIEYKNAYGSYSDDFAALRQDAVDNGKTIYDLAAYRDVQKKQEAVSQMADKLLKDSYDYAPALKAKADYTMSDLRSHQQGFMRESQMYAGHKNGASEERVRAVQQYLTTFENTRTMWDMISSSAKEAGTISFYTPQYKSWPSTLINLKSQMDNILADPAQYEAAFKQNGYSIDKIKENEERINSAIQRHEHAGYAAGLAEKYRKEFDAFVGLRGEYQSSFGNDGEERRRAVLVEQLSADAKSLMKTAQELAGDKAFTPHLAHNKLTPGMIYQHIAQDIEAYAEHVTGRNQEAVEAVEHSIDVDAIDPDILLTDYIRVNSEYDEIYKALVGSIGKPGHEAQTEEYYYARKKIAQQLTAMGAGILEHKKITDEQLSKASLSIKEVEERHSLHMKVSKKQSKEQKHEISRSRDRGRDADEYSIDVDAIGPAQKAKADYTMSDLRSHQQGFKRESQMYAGHENAISEEHTRVVKQYREVFNYTKEMWNHISASAEEASIAHFYTPQYMSWPSAITKIKSQMDNILADPAQYEAAFNKHGFRIDKIIENEELISKAIQQHEHASYAAELAEKYRKEFDMFVGLRGEYHSSFGNDGEEGRRAGLVEQMSVVAKPLMKTAQELAGDKAFTPYLAHNKLTPEMISQHIAQDLKAYAEHVTGRNQEAAEHSIDVDAIDPDILLTDYICVNREYDKVYVDLLSSLGKPGLSAKNEEYYYARKKIAQQLTVMGAGILGHMKITGEQLSKASLSIKEIEERHSLYMKVSQKQSRVQTRKITQSHGRDAAEYRIDVDTIDPEVLLADYVRVNSEYDKVYVDLLSSLGKPGLSAKNEEYYHARKKLAQQLTAMGAGILEHKKITAEQLSKASLSIKEVEDRHSLHMKVSKKQSREQKHEISRSRDRGHSM